MKSIIIEGIIAWGPIRTPRHLSIEIRRLKPVNFQKLKNIGQAKLLAPFLTKDWKLHTMRS